MNEKQIKKREPKGCCIMRREDMHFKPKNCKLCGKGFQPESPSEAYCSKECRERAQKSSKCMSSHAKKSLEYYYKRREKQNKVKHCYLCGEELQDLRQFVHYECVIKAVLSGNVTTKIRKYINNHGLTMKEIKKEYKGV